MRVSIEYQACAGEAEFERPAPGVGDEVSADIPASLRKDGQEPKVLTGRVRGGWHHASFHEPIGSIRLDEGVAWWDKLKFVR